MNAHNLIPRSPTSTPDEVSSKRVLIDLMLAWSITSVARTTYIAPFVLVLHIRLNGDDSSSFHGA